MIGKGFSTADTSEDVETANLDDEDTVEEFVTPSATTWTVSPAATGASGGTEDVDDVVAKPFRIDFADRTLWHADPIT